MSPCIFIRQISLPYSLHEPLEGHRTGCVKVGGHGVVLGPHCRLAAFEGAVDARLDGRQVADHAEDGHDGEEVAGGDSLLGLGGETHMTFAMCVWGRG